MNNYLFDNLFAKHIQSDNTFLIQKNGPVISYKGFLQGAAKFANVLQSLGVEAGDRVAVQVAKSPQSLMIYAACIEAGAVFLPLNTAYTSHEVGYFIGDATPKVFICDGKNIDEYSSLFSYTIVLDLNNDGTGSLCEKAKLAGMAFNVVDRKKDDLAAILYTSGTTGRSKGAMLSHGNLMSNTYDLTELWQFEADDVLLHALPIFHTHGLFVATNVCVHAGCAMIFLPAFSVDDIVEQLPHATTMMGVPTFYTRLVDDPRLNKELVKNCRLFISGSAPLLADTHEAFFQRTGHKILERYGMTETNMNTSNPFDGDRRPGTVGLALKSVNIRITDFESGEILPKKQVGSIEVKGANVFLGYWNMPEKTAEEFKDDGYFITGDVGVLSVDNYLSIVGREKDLIISGGYNIYPKEIETIIDEVPGIKESTVIGIPHADFGESVLALVVLENGQIITEETIMSAVKESLARFKHPRKIIFVEELLRNTMGKVQKNILRKQYTQALAG
ncbi:MAG: malonyl-CoA synthase [Pseudomonadota bacterium]